jgi:hypothetical protein
VCQRSSNSNNPLYCGWPPFHAEVAALAAILLPLPCSERGGETLRHFLFDIAKMTGDWKMEDVLNEEKEKIRQQVGEAT